MLGKLSSVGAALRIALLVALPVLASAGAAAQDNPKVEVVAQLGHSGSVASVVFSPDGRRVLSGSEDNTLRLWEVATGRLIRVFKGHSSSVTSVAFSHDGAHVLSGSWDKTVKLWDATTGQLLRTFKGHSSAVTSVAFSPDGSGVLSGSEDKTLMLWDAATGRPVRTFKGHADGVTSVAFSPDGSNVLSGSRDKTVKLWVAATGRLLRTFEGLSQVGVRSVAFSPDGNTVLSSESDHLVGNFRLWDVATGQLVRTFGRIRAGVSVLVAFSRDGRSVLSSDHVDGAARLWDTATGRLLRTFSGHHRLRAAVFSPDGRNVLSGNTDSALELWDLATGQLVRTFKGHSWRVRSVAFSPDGHGVLSAGDDKTLRLWDAPTGRLVRAIEAHSDEVTSVAFAPDGRSVLSGGSDEEKHTIKLWDVGTGRLVRAIEGHSDRVNSVAFSPDGSSVLSGSRNEDLSGDGTLMLWDAATGRLLRTFKGHVLGVTSVAFSPNGRNVLSGSPDAFPDGTRVGEKSLKLWDAATGRLVRTFKAGWVGPVAFSPDGRSVLSGGMELSLWKELSLWNASTGRLVRTFKGSGVVTSIAFSPNGRSVLSGGDTTLKLWDAATGRLLRTFEGHLDQVASVAFSPDGRNVISASDDGTIRFWSLVTGREVVKLIAGTGGDWLAITPAGFFDYQGDIDKFVHLVAPRRDGKGLETFSINQTFKELYRPDLVQAALKGDPKGAHKDAAFHLDLEKILDSGPAPQIEHLDKKTERAGDTIKLTVRIVDAGGGIGPRVLWRVNGQTQGKVEPDELKGAQAPSLSGFTLTETLRIDPSKDNIVELTAYNGKGLLATPPFQITVPKVGVATAGERSRMYVLAIGVDEYRMQSYKLKYAVNDTLKFAKALQLVGSTLFAEVKTTILTDKQVTEQAIASAFDRIGPDAKVGDVFVLYLAGHGKAIAGKYYYYPETLEADQSVERHGIGQDKWEKWLAKVGKVQKSVLFLDTCYGGTATDLVRSDDGAIETAMNHLKHATGQNLIAASRQAAYEGYKGHGVLTYALLEALHKTDASGGDDTVRIWALPTTSTAGCRRSPRSCSKSSSGRSSGCWVTFPSASVNR